MLLAKLISQTHMHAIFRLVSQDPRDRIYSKGLDVVDLEKIAPVPGREKYVLDICFHRATYGSESNDLVTPFVRHLDVLSTKSE